MSNEASEKALQKYTLVKQEVLDHIEANQPVFSAHEKIVGRLIDAENELRDAVADAKQGISNESVIVTYTPQSQTFVDPDAVRARQGQVLTPQVISELIVTTERPARVTISQPRT